MTAENRINAPSVTHLLSAIDQGDPQAPQELLPLVYNELRKLAAHRMAQESAGQTLQPTALVHEAWLRLVGSNQRWDGRGHFFAAAAEAMRRILIDRARKRNRQRHGGGLQRVELDSVDWAVTTDDDTLLAMDAAIEKLAAESPELARLVTLRYFTGLSMAETAQALGVSVATANRRWAYARAWLYCELSRDA